MLLPSPLLQTTSHEHFLKPRKSLKLSQICKKKFSDAKSFIRPKIHKFRQIPTAYLICLIKHIKIFANDCENCPNFIDTPCICVFRHDLHVNIKITLLIKIVIFNVNILLLSRYKSINVVLQKIHSA